MHQRLLRPTFRLAMAIPLLALGVGFVNEAVAASGCVGTIKSVYVESNGDVYTEMSNAPGCSCNYSPAGIYAFRTPAAQANSKQTYSTVLTALVSGRQVQIWYDWTSGTPNASPCIAYNAKIFS